MEFGKYSIVLAALLVGGCGQSVSNIGLYPGDPEENFAPALVPAGKEYRNLALNRAEFHWINAPVSGRLQLSRDGKRWKDAGPLASEVRVESRDKVSFVTD